MGSIVERAHSCIVIAAACGEVGPPLPARTAAGGGGRAGMGSARAANPPGILSQETYFLATLNLLFANQKKLTLIFFAKWARSTDRHFTTLPPARARAVSVHNIDLGWTVCQHLPSDTRHQKATWPLSFVVLATGHLALAPCCKTNTFFPHWDVNHKQAQLCSCVSRGHSDRWSLHVRLLGYPRD